MAKPSNPIIISIQTIVFIPSNYNINGKFSTNRTLYNRGHGVLSN